MIESRDLARRSRPAGVPTATEARRCERDLQARMTALEGELEEARKRAVQAKGRGAVLAESLRTCQMERKEALDEAATLRGALLQRNSAVEALESRLAVVQKALGEVRFLQGYSPVQLF